MKILTLNVQGINSYNKRRILLEMLRKDGMDLFAIFETKIRKAKIINWDIIEQDFILYENRSNSSALGIMVGYRTISFMNKSIRFYNIGRRAVAIVINDKHDSYMFIFVHAPILQQYREKFFHDIRLFIMEMNIKNT